MIVETSVVICEECGIFGTFVCHEHIFKRFLEQRSLSTCASFLGWQCHFVPSLHKLSIISGLARRKSFTQALQSPLRLAQPYLCFWTLSNPFSNWVTSGVSPDCETVATHDAPEIIAP